MLKVINKDILTVTEGFICHQVNCMGVMNAGIAKAIRAKWPVVYDVYMINCQVSPKYRPDLLGDINIVPVEKNLYVVNVFGQLTYGRDGIFTRYEAVIKAFTELSELINQRPLTANMDKLPVYIPFNMGCGLAGGNWPEYESIIEDLIPSAIVCKLG